MTETDTSPRNDLRLHAGSLTSKWGFSDGDLVGDWALDNDALADIDEVLALDEHAVLIALVRQHLMPALAAYGIVLAEISTNHNPIRARTVNGVEVDWYDTKWAWPFEDITVTVPAADVISHITTALAEGNHS
jgi:hypothetical protein